MNHEIPMLGDAFARATIAAMNASAIHDLLEDGLFGVSASEPASEPVLLSAPSARLRPSALAA